MHLYLSTLLSLVTAIISIQSVELDPKTMLTFIAYYIILGSMSFMFGQGVKFINPKTAQMLQFSFYLLGSVLMLTGVLGMLAGNKSMAIVFLLTLFLPGLTSVRAGIHFNKIGE